MLSGKVGGGGDSEMMRLASIGSWGEPDPAWSEFVKIEVPALPPTMSTMSGMI